MTMTEIIYETVVDFFSYSLLCSINVFELGIGTILTVGSDNPKLQFLKNTSGLYGGRNFSHKIAEREETEYQSIH